MQVIMDITGIDNAVVVSIPDTVTIGKGIFPITKEEAENMAIEAVCMIKENDIDIIEITQENDLKIEAPSLIKAMSALLRYIADTKDQECPEYKNLIKNLEEAKNAKIMKVM